MSIVPFYWGGSKFPGGFLLLRCQNFDLRVVLSVNGAGKGVDTNGRDHLYKRTGRGGSEAICSFSLLPSTLCRPSLLPSALALACGAWSICWRATARTTLPPMLMYGKEASNRKQEIDRQHHTIPNQRKQRPKDKHCGNVHNRLWNHG